MASIHNDIPLNASARDVWDAVRDFGSLHERLAPGFVTACALDGDARIVTFANGSVAREIWSIATTRGSASSMPSATSG